VTSRLRAAASLPVEIANEKETDHVDVSRPDLERGHSHDEGRSHLVLGYQGRRLAAIAELIASGERDERVAA
jgi:hypothetical protein